MKIQSEETARAKDTGIKKTVSYWNPDCCPACGSSDTELFSFKENEHEYVRGFCHACGHEWQSIRNDWGC